MEYRILGPLEVVDEGEPVPLGRLALGRHEQVLGELHVLVGE